MSWINKIGVEDYKQARIDAAVLRLNRLSMEVVMTQDQYNYLYKQILAEFDNITE